MRSSARRPPPQALDILRYYVVHPHTADSFEGIAEWRLLEDMVRRRLSETQEALEWLVEQGFLDRSVESPAVPALYRINPRARKAAEQLLADRDDGRRARHARGK